MDIPALIAQRDYELSKARHLNPLRLTHHGYKVYSQSDEDGIIAEIFKRIGIAKGTFVEFGVGDGNECNTLWPLVLGWSGLWLQGDAASCEVIRRRQAGWIESGHLEIRERFITVDNVDAEVSSSAAGADIDLLSIDIDYNDYWVWSAIRSIKPRAVVIEYNASWPPPAALAVPYLSSAVWDGTNYFGASIAAMSKLGRQKGYQLVGCNLSGVNAFFVRDDLCADHFLNPGSAREHYEPARYHFAALPAGHPPCPGPVVQIV